MWVTRLSIVDWVCSKTQILLGTLRTQNQFREESGSRTFVTISWLCRKQTSVSHRSTESEIISLDAGLRMDGVCALDLWDLVIEALRSTSGPTSPTNPATSGNGCETGLRNKSKPKQKGHRDVDQLSYVDYVSTNAQFFSRRVPVVDF